MERLLYSRKEAAYQLGGISLRKLDYMIEQGRIQVRINGRRKFIHADDLARASKQDHPST